jgi:hypothetical protein
LNSNSMMSASSLLSGQFLYYGVLSFCLIFSSFLSCFSLRNPISTLRRNREMSSLSSVSSTSVFVDMIMNNNVAPNNALFVCWHMG